MKLMTQFSAEVKVSEVSPPLCLHVLMIWYDNG